MEFISSKKTDYTLMPPLIFCPMMSYESTHIRERFVQMSGRLVSLGYSELVLPQMKDFEHEIYLSLCHTLLHPEVTAIYEELERKKIKDKWRVILSYLRNCHSFYVKELPIHETGDRWKYYCNKKKMAIYCEKCLELNQLDEEELGLVRCWFSYMKHPMY